jgi:two-component system, chemotaxis family, sensor kinase CheA
VNFFSDDSGADLKQLFFESAQELLQALNEEGLRLEQNARDPDVVRRVRRIVHTLKGDSAACGYHELSELAHQVEDVLTSELARSGAAPLAELILRAADTFTILLAAYRTGTPLPSSEPLRALIQSIVPEQEEAKQNDQQKRKSGSGPAKSVAFHWTEYEQRVIAAAISQGGKVLQVTVELDPACPTRAAAYPLVRKALEAAGEILVIHPESDSPEPSTRIEAAIVSKSDVAAVRRKCQIPTVVSTVQVVPHSTENKASPSAHQPNAEDRASASAVKTGSAVKSASGAAPSSAAESTLRVEAERVDAVLNLVGELIIGKSMLHQTISEFERRFPKELRGKFSDVLAFQTRVLSDLQKSVMKIRMVPVEQLFRRFPRVVRDLSKACGKDVALETSGEETELDKSILDVLAEPLTHLIRNAVDHGIESPEERATLGKAAHGTIRLNAFHQGNEVVIEVSDDGRGINRDKIIARALARKIISKDEAAAISDNEALEMIFHPDLSTAEEVTSISGRGVGMDVVKTVLERLKGSVQIETHVGHGTRFYLKVPLTLAIIKALLFRVSDKLYAVPLASVLEITRTSDAEIHQVEQHEVMQLREEVLTLVRLDKLSSNYGQRAARKLFVIVIRLAERKFGLVVDKLVGEEELVIKALSDRLVATELVSGASILGDGTVVLILNLRAVVSRLGKMQPAGGSRMPASQKEVRA